MAENKNKMMMIIIIVLLAVLLVTIAAVSVIAYRVISNNSDPQADAQQQIVPTLKPEEIDVIPLATPISTNLAMGADGNTHLIKVSLATGVNNTDKKNSPDFTALVTAKEPIIRDVMLGVIKSKTYEELSRPDGRDILRDEILSKLQNTFRSNLLVSIYISDWVLQ